MKRKEYKIVRSKSSSHGAECVGPVANNSISGSDLLVYLPWSKQFNKYAGMPQVFQFSVMLLKSRPQSGSTNYIEQENLFVWLHGQIQLFNFPVPFQQDTTTMELALDLSVQLEIV